MKCNFQHYSYQNIPNAKTQLHNKVSATQNLKKKLIKVVIRLRYWMNTDKDLPDKTKNTDSLEKSHLICPGTGI